MHRARRPVVGLLSGAQPSDEAEYCGVATYTKRLPEAILLQDPDLEVRHLRFPTGRIREWVRLIRQTRADILHVQYPSEGWGTSIAPGVVPAIARRAGCRLVVTLHEWSLMHPLRKLSVAPLLRAADAIVFVSPKEADEFGAG